MLVSRNLSGSDRLRRCAVDHAAHVTPGSRGEFVRRIQRALMAIDGLMIDQAELDSMTYGKSTAAAVLAYKTKRSIINRSYQSKPDDIVGIMTITALDRELAHVELLSRAQCSMRAPGQID